MSKRRDTRPKDKNETEQPASDDAPEEKELTTARIHAIGASARLGLSTKEELDHLESMLEQHGF